MKFSLIKSLAVATLASAVLVACGGGGDEYAPLVANATIAVTANTAASLKQESITFASGSQALGTTTPTTLVVKDSGVAATPLAFEANSSEGAASGILTFGSCIFQITASTYPAGHRLAVGNKIVISECKITIETANAGTTGQKVDVPATLALGGTVTTTKPGQAAQTTTVPVQFSEKYTETVVVAPNGTSATLEAPGGTVTITVPKLTGGA